MIVQQPEYFKICIEIRRKLNRKFKIVILFWSLHHMLYFLICPVIPCLIPSLPSAVLLLWFCTSLSFYCVQTYRFISGFSCGFWGLWKLSAQPLLGTYCLKNYKMDFYVIWYWASTLRVMWIALNWIELNFVSAQCNPCFTLSSDHIYVSFVICIILCTLET
jgi:hypothetical protein